MFFPISLTFNGFLYTIKIASVAVNTCGVQPTGNRKSDPFQLYNIAAHHPAKAKELFEQLRLFMAEQP